jgi:anti-sigma regulatory factor (Ser/Thr protein kinase)
VTGEAALDFAMELPTRTEWSSLDVVRRSIQKRLSANFVDEGCQTVAMVARELLENATKYGQQLDGETTVRLQIKLRPPHVDVLVENRVKSIDRTRELLALLEWMKQFGTAAEAFHARLVMSGGGGGLGIVRIAHEANCAVTAGVVGSTLRVTAHIPLEDGWWRLTASGNLVEAALKMESLITGDLRVDASQADATSPIVLAWRGNSVDANPSQTVTPYCRGIYDVALDKNVPIEMHFKELEYFNSGTISVLIQLIQEARTRRLTLLLTYDPSVKWQRLNFEALSVFAKGEQLITLRAV